MKDTIQSDAHFWIFMFPKNEKDNVKIIDWQGFGNGPGTRDIAYMIALFWFPDQRQKYELELLKIYHDTLINSSNIHNYSFNDLMLDYRRSVIGNILIPIWQWEHKLWTVIWYYHLERIFMAYEDLNCAELLE